MNRIKPKQGCDAEHRIVLPYPLELLVDANAIREQEPLLCLADTVLPLLAQAQAIARAGYHAMQSPTVENDCDSLAKAFELLAEQLRCAQELIKLCTHELETDTPAEKGGDQCT